MNAARRRRFGRVAVLGGIAVVGTVGCQPEAVTSQGDVVYDLWNIFLVPAVVVAAIVWGLTTFAILRYRRGTPAPGRGPVQTSGDMRLEFVWTALPIATVLVLFWLTLGALGKMGATSDGGIAVSISAFRWQWQFDYPADGVTVIGTPDVPAEMVVPVGEPVHVTLTSPDVVHSFYVPAFLFKRDATPGRPTEFEFTVQEAGAYGGQCAEFCGVFHARMLMTVRAVPRADYDAWLAQHQARASATP